ncbi:hypothetical protein [Gordonia sihwensis]|uniref:hypothetical protein n=1 Tax=Gordonia TaxID=2053 RepID=UPI0024176BB0|nr:hypothetical protein [Gordonia sihwensis]WFN92970.1 hypothetical protein P5P27_19925 [Gordonia sihwensis]
MKNLGILLRELERSERLLAGELESIARDHPTDPEIHYLAADLAAWSRNHAGAVRSLAVARGVESEAAFDTQAAVGPSSVFETPARELPASLLPVAELCGVCQRIAGLTMQWEILGQGAAATNDSECSALVDQCLSQAERQFEWARNLVRTLSPQALSAG